MVRRTVTIQSELNMDSRPIAHLVQEASQYSSSVCIEMKNKQINAKSIMGMMSLELGKGTTFTVVANGEDEESAVSGVEAFFASH